MFSRRQILGPVFGDHSPRVGCRWPHKIRSPGPESRRFASRSHRTVPGSSRWATAWGASCAVRPRRRQPTRRGAAWAPQSLYSPRARARWGFQSVTAAGSTSLSSIRFPSPIKWAHADFRPPTGLVTSAIVAGLGIPFFSNGQHPSFPGQAPPSFGSVGTPVPEPGSGLLALLGLAGLILIGRLGTQSPGERRPAFALHSRPRRARSERFSASS